MSPTPSAGIIGVYHYTQFKFFIPKFNPIATAMALIFGEAKGKENRAALRRCVIPVRLTAGRMGWFCLAQHFFPFPFLSGNKSQDLNLD